MKLTLDQTLGIVRHVLTGLGSLLVYKGVLSADNMEVIVGSVLTIVSVIWSIKSKKLG
jgi:hypothetical protein